MKILERGTLPDNLLYKLRCRTCQTLFEFTQGEAELKPDHRDGNYLRIACPVCKAECTTRPKQKE